MGWPRFAFMRVLQLVFAILSPCRVALAAEDQIVIDQANSKWTVAPNGTWTVDADLTIRAPKDNPSHVVRLPLNWSASTETLTVVQARIDKPNGTSVVLEKAAVRDDPLIGDAHFHEFSDERRLLVTFPNAEPGDLLVVRSRRDVFQPRVPGGFMAAPVLDRNVAWDEANFTINVPADMPFQYEARGFDHQSELIKDRMVHYLHASKSLVPPAKAIAVGEFDRLPRFAVSTFRDWDEFGRAYASILVPHAKVTPAIAALAAKLTAGRNDPREQAAALYEWVRDNVRHIPIPLEQSQPRPNDAEQVMTKLYGDDADHVVLLYALLAARQIPAEIVLLNASNSATIADPPNIRPMDHLILFLPKFNVYVDTTLGVAPFGILSFGEIGKPAIHLGGSGLARRTIPMPPSGATATRLKTDMVLGADGDVSGTTTTAARGAFGIWLRGTARTFLQSDPAAAVTLLRQLGTPGTGTFTYDDPAAPGNDYTLHGTFRLENQSALLHGGFFAPWTGLRILSRPGDILAGPMFAEDLPVTEPAFCYPGIEIEELTLTLPEGSTLGGLPPDTTIDTELVRYRSHWSMDGQRVTVAREFQSLAPGPVCEGRAREGLADVLTKVRDDLLSSVGIKQDTIPIPVDPVPDPDPKPE